MLPVAMKLMEQLGGRNLCKEMCISHNHGESGVSPIFVSFHLG